MMLLMTFFMLSGSPHASGLPYECIAESEARTRYSGRGPDLASAQEAALNQCLSLSFQGCKVVHCGKVY